MRFIAAAAGVAISSLLNSPQTPLYDAFSKSYDTLDGRNPVTQALGIETLRRHAGALIKGGAVLEVAVGTGLQAVYYPWEKITSFTGVDDSEGMLENARQRIPLLAGSVPVVLAQADATVDLGLPSSSFDTVVDTFSLCVMDRPGDAVREMTRVLKPGGKLVIATWCQRETTPESPFTAQENDELRFLYEEWSHPYFISIEEYERLLKGTGVMASVHSEDWAPFTLPAWRHSIWVGVWDPWPVVARPRVWYKTLRDAWCLERMHRAFDKGLMKYGMLTAKKAVV